MGEDYDNDKTIKKKVSVGHNTHTHTHKINVKIIGFQLLIGIPAGPLKHFLLPESIH